MDECIIAYTSLAKDVFKIDQVLGGRIPIGDDQSRFDYNVLETAIKGVVASRLGDENAIMEEVSVSRCPTFVVATPGLHADGPPTLLRTYGCRGHNAERCTIWKAARATSAAPTFFKPAVIEIPPPGRIFVDGGLGHNNPSELALEEVQKIWPSVQRCCLVSIGTGRQKSVKFIENSVVTTTEEPQGILSLLWGAIPGATTVSRSVSGLATLKKIGEACVALTTNSEMVHQRVFRRSASENFPYYRFNVERGMDDIGLQEWEKTVEMGDHTSRYMAEGEGELKRDNCVQDLMAASALDGGQSQQGSAFVPRLRR